MTNRAAVRHLGLVGLFVSIPTLAVAGERASTTTTSTITQEADKAVQATKDYTAQQKKAFQKKAQAELDEIQSQIAQLRAKTAKASAGARADLQKTIGELEQKKDAARKKLEEIKASSTSAWNHLRVGMDGTLQDLKSAYQRAVSQLP